MSSLQCSALGRPFQLGMLYSMPSDTLITGLSLWDKERLEASTRKMRKVGSFYEISTTDSMDDRLKSVGVSADLSLSVAIGLVKVGGSAMYLNGNKASNNVARVTLRYSCTSFFEQLTMEQLGNIQYPQVLTKPEVTHVVTGIEYGADAFFVFETELQKTEERHEIQGKMEVQIRKIPKCIFSQPQVHPEGNIEATNVVERKSFHCKFYGDVLANEHPSSYQDAMKLYKQLPSLLGNDYENTVPKVVYLTPLHELDEKQARVVRKINDSLVRRTHEAIESFEQIESRAQLLLKNETVGKFAKIRSSLERFKRTVESVKVRFIRQLADLIPNIRSGKSEEDKLVDLTSTTSKMYFDSQVFSAWLDIKDQEIRCLEQYLDMASCIEGVAFEFDHTSFALVVEDPRSTSTVVSFQFKVATEKEDSWLDQLSGAIESNQPLPETFQCPKTSKWTANPVIRSDLNAKMGRFLGLAEARNNGRISKVRFMVTSSSSEAETMPPRGKGAVLMVHHHNATGTELDPACDSSRIQLELDMCCVMKGSRKISLPKPTKASLWDTERYRKGYPGKEDDSSVNCNFEFYCNQRKSEPEGDFIDNIHKKWWGDYKQLDSHKYYIQWLFPIREQGINRFAKELQPHEVKRIRGNPAAEQRFLKSYEMMLDFYGLKLKDQRTGAVERSQKWQERFDNLNSKTALRTRHLQIITRILKCLGEFGFEHLKVPLIKHLMFAAVVEGTLENTLTSCMIYWVEVVKNDTEREGLHQYARELIQRVT